LGRSPQIVLEEADEPNTESERDSILQQGPALSVSTSDQEVARSRAASFLSYSSVVSEDDAPALFAPELNGDATDAESVARGFMWSLAQQSDTRAANLQQQLLRQAQATGIALSTAATTGTPTFTFGNSNKSLSAGLEVQTINSPSMATSDGTNGARRLLSTPTMIVADANDAERAAAPSPVVPVVKFVDGAHFDDDGWEHIDFAHNAPFVYCTLLCVILALTLFE
jgi:hypothetical protein